MVQPLNYLRETASQTAGPYGAGALGDLNHNIGDGLLAASGVLLIGAALALAQRPLRRADRTGP